MPFSFNPIHYILLGVILLLLGMSGYAWVTKERLDVCDAKYRAFVAESDAVANAQKARNLEEIAKRDSVTKDLTEQNDKLQSNLDRKYATYRMRNTKAGSGNVPTLPSTAKETIATDESRLAGTLERLETGVLELSKSRDEAINQSNLCADWLAEQLKVVDTHVN
jgi:hypothetical protein